MPYRSHPISPRLLAAGAAERGTTRCHNEDRFQIAHGPSASVCVVADGMGGLAAGSAASEIVTRVTTELLANPSVEPTQERIQSAIRAANRAVLEAAKADVRLRGIGSTVALLVVEGAAAYVAHVGDSRVYRIRGGGMTALTEDHSLLNYVRAEKEKNPGFSFDESTLVDLTKVITRALGVGEDVEVDQSSFEARPGDVFLLCTDGITGALNDREILSALLGSGEEVDDVERACAALVREALKRGEPTPDRAYPSGDDIGLIVARVVTV